MQIENKIHLIIDRELVFVTLRDGLVTQLDDQRLENMPGDAIVLPVWIAIADQKNAVQKLLTVTCAHDVVFQLGDGAFLFFHQGFGKTAQGNYTDDMFVFNYG